MPIRIGELRILRESFGVMSTVWRNPKILGNSGCSGSLESRSLQIVFTQRKRTRKFHLWYRDAFGAKGKDSLVPITQNVNKTRYVQVRLLRRHPFPVIHQMISFGMQLEDILF